MELTIETLIKLILGVLVIVLVVSALFFFGSQVGGFFGNLPGGNEEENSESSGSQQTNNDENNAEEETGKTVNCKEECNGKWYDVTDWCSENECNAINGCLYIENPWWKPNDCINK